MRGDLYNRAPMHRFEWLAAAALMVGCAAAPAYDNGGGGGGGGSGGAAATGGGGAGGTGGGGPVGPVVLPVPPGAANVPQPSGSPGNLKVVHWAGFKAALTYTFDDAQPSQIEHYADLQAMGVPLTFYITTTSSSSSGSFDATFKQAVRDGHEMGNHTVHHCQADLTNCSNTSSAATSLDAELDDCTSYIVSHFGQPGVWTAASPYGDTGYDVPDMSRFFLNRGVGSGTIAPNDSTDPFNLPCHAAVEGETVDSFDAQIDGAESGGRWLIFLVHTVTPTSASWYAPIDISVVTGSAAHAKSLGDVWIGAAVDVGAYWRAEKALTAATPTTAGGVQTWSWTLPAHFPPGRSLRITVDGGTVSQMGAPVAWDGHGYYEISLDAGSLTLSP